MPSEHTRRTLLGALLGGGIGATALSPASGLLETFSPLSGDVWREARRDVPDTVSSPHGDATVTYDDYHVPHVRADSEAAAYYAVGYVQAADRLFEMDLLRRLMDGRLSAALGETTVESDRFHAKMDFRGAAEASARALAEWVLVTLPPDDPFFEGDRLSERSTGRPRRSRRRRPRPVRTGTRDPGHGTRRRPRVPAAGLRDGRGVARGPGMGIPGP